MGIIFDEVTCDIMWYQVKKGFHQDTYNCDEVIACLEPANAGGGCRWELSRIAAKPKEQPQWILLPAAYAAVLGEIQWHAHMQALDSHIKQLTRGKDSLDLKKTGELIQSKLTPALDNTIEVIKDALGKEIDRMVKEKEERTSLR